MNRRSVLALMGWTAMWPIIASAREDDQPAIGFLNSRSLKTDARLLAAFHQGLGESGFVEGRNASILYRWADGRNDRLPALAAELVRQKPKVIVAVGGSAVALAVKSLNADLPVVFAVGGDPVALGMVASLSRPGGNMTGVTMVSAGLDAKRMELLRDIAPAAKVVAVLMNPANPSAASELQQARAAAAAYGQKLHVFEANTDQGIEIAFRAIGRLRADALAVASDGFLIGRRARIVALANELRVPAIYAVREFTEAGGLVSYGTNFAEMYRQVGIYAGRILKGEAPASLPVQQPTRYELVINLKTAGALGIGIPPSILLRADATIE